jgi:hypothetical protein
MKTGLAVALAACLLAPSLANALSRMPTARTLVKPTKELILKELRARVPSGMCIPPYSINQIKMRSKAVKSPDGTLVRQVSYTALRTPASNGGHKGTCKIKASIAPACGIDIKMTNFKLKAFWPAQ